METEEHDQLSDIMLDFGVTYFISQGTARLDIKTHTRAAEEYGVRYQLGYTRSRDENPRLSPPMTIEEARNQELGVDILRGGSLIVRMVDRDENHLAAAKIDSTNWPSAEKGEIVHSNYTLPVPKDRLS